MSLLYLSRKQILTNMNAEPLQNHHEFAELIDKLRHEQIVNVVEIGCADGGWLGILAGCIGRPLNILAIDPDPNSHPHPGNCPSDYPRKFSEVATMLREEGHSVDHLALSSQSADAIHAAQKWAERLGGVDLLHIDGDHSMRGCLADWESYRSLVRPGGLVVFHDTCNTDEPGVRAVFSAIQEKGIVEQSIGIQAIDGSPKGRGVGIIRIPPCPTRHSSAVMMTAPQAAF